MGVQRLNHAVLYVRDVERSVAFYRDALGFRPVMRSPGAAFLQAAGSSNDHDLGHDHPRHNDHDDGDRDLDGNHVGPVVDQHDLNLDLRVKLAGR